jgi:hypothetical protein
VPRIRDSPRKLAHQHIVIDAVEEVLQIHIHYPPAPTLDEPLRGEDRLVRSASTASADFSLHGSSRRRPFGHEARSP